MSKSKTSTAKPPHSGSGTPPWMAIVGALVAVSGAAYVWFSHFNPKSETPKPPTPVVPIAQGQAGLVVSGNGSVGVAGNVSNSPITIGNLLPAATTGTSAASGPKK